LCPLGLKNIDLWVKGCYVFAHFMYSKFLFLLFDFDKRLLGRIILYLHHGFYFVIFVCPHGRFSNLHYYNINKSIKLVYVYDDKKRSIAYSLDLEGGRKSFRVAYIVIWATVWWQLVIFLLPFFSLSYLNIHAELWQI
jgi:hypothetical protein